MLGLKIPKIVIGDSGKIQGVGLAIGRQHPGEPVGSWMTEGFLKKLDGSANQNNFLWVVIPMLNVDGVVLGNNRTGIVGYDLNRLYNMGEKGEKGEDVVEVRLVLELVRKMKKKYGKLFQLFLDFHGHSSQ